MAINIKMKMWELLLSILVIIVIPIILINMYIDKKNAKKPEEIILANEIIGMTAKKKNLKVMDSDGAIFYLPKGFKISEDILEPKVAEGIVIVDDTGDEQTNGSEFIWIPVEHGKFVPINSYMYGELSPNFDKYTNGNNETEEYKKMKQSILRYGGFYIARYEAGISEKMLKEISDSEYLENDEIVKDTTEKFGSGKYKPVSRKETIVWGNIKWGGTFNEQALDGLAGNDNENGAVKIARNMYNQKSKTTVNSTLCYGIQWDAVMNFIDCNYYDGKCAIDSVLLNNNMMQNESRKLEKSGNLFGDNIKNIYDLFGNASEWTMEGYGDKHRVVRGRSYADREEQYSVSSRKEFYPSDYYNDLGFRVALYIGNK